MEPKNNPYPKYEVGDTLRCDKPPGWEYLSGEYRVLAVRQEDRDQLVRVEDGGPWIWSNRFTLVKRASESQRDGWFAVGQRVRVVEDTCVRPFGGAVGDVGPVESVDCDGDVWVLLPCSGTALCVARCDLEPADPAPAQQTSQYGLGQSTEGVATRSVALPQAVAEPPQPAPMTRAARVLAGLERDPYNEHGISGRQRSLDEDNIADMTTSHSRNEAARLRMARMSLDRPLDAEQARWERLVCSKVPVGRR